MYIIFNSFTQNGAKHSSLLVGLRLAQRGKQGVTIIIWKMHQHHMFLTTNHESEKSLAVSPIVFVADLSKWFFLMVRFGAPACRFLVLESASHPSLLCGDAIGVNIKTKHGILFLHGLKKSCPTSPPGGDLVNGLPPVANTHAVMLGADFVR